MRRLPACTGAGAFLTARGAAAPARAGAGTFLTPAGEAGRRMAGLRCSAWREGLRGGPSLSHHQAAVDLDFGARNVTRLVGSQKGGQPGRVAGFANVAQRRLLQPVRAALFVRVAQHVRLQPAGQHRVDRDAKGAQFPGQAVNHPQQGGLGGAVVQGMGRAGQGGLGGIEDDAAVFAAAPEPGQGGAAGIEGAVHIDSHHAAPFLIADVLRAPGNEDAGGVHQDIQPAQEPGCAGNKFHGLARVGEVGPQGEGPSAEFRDAVSGLERAVPAAQEGQRHIRAAARQLQADFPADAPGAAADQGLFRLQVDHSGTSFHHHSATGTLFLDRSFLAFKGKFIFLNHRLQYAFKDRNSSST